MPVYVGLSAEFPDPEAQKWLDEQWKKGAKIQYYPCMDSSDYGMHYLYEFEDPELAAICKLKFKTVEA